ncbi:MAG: hypothetical protein ACXVW3_16620, partial [Nocardioidaceae bacterium]
EDLWLHARDAPGAHVVLRDNEGRAGADDLREAAEVAAFFSEARGESLVDVHVTRRKHVKPAKGGSALGCTVVREPGALAGAMVNAFAYGDTALVEHLVEGTEVAVPVVDTGDGPRALPVVAIEPDGGVYDYTARYTAGSTEFVVPAKLPDDLAAECARVAVAAHEALGLRDLSRSDLMVDADGTVWFLEVNVAPGLTETSTVPLSVQAAGLDLGALMAELVRIAIERRS